MIVKGIFTEIFMAEPPPRGGGTPRRTMMVWGGNIFGGTISDNLAQEWLKGDGEE